MPGKRDEQREAGADRRHAGEEDAEDSGRDRAHGDRPEAAEGDPSGRLYRQRGGRLRPREGVAEGLSGARGATDVEADRQRQQPPDRGDDQRPRVAVAVGGDRRDRRQRGRLGAGEQDGHAQQVRIRHRYPASASSIVSQPAGPSTSRSASSASSGGASGETTPTQTALFSSPPSRSSRRRRKASRSVRSSPA